jgi:hypothetical protein
MKTTLFAAGVTLALLIALVPLAGAQPMGPGVGPGQHMGRGRAPGAQMPETGRGPGAGPGAAIAATIPGEVRESIDAAVRGAAARVLRIAPEDLEKELAAGKTMAALASEKNVSLTTVRNAMVNARRFAVNQALAAGKITREQANALLQAGPRALQGRGRGMGPGSGIGPGRETGPGRGIAPSTGMGRGMGMHHRAPSR